MNKIITLAALLFAGLSLAYAIWQKRTAEGKVREAETRGMQQRISEQDVFPHPTKEFLERYTRNSCIGIADQIKTNAFSDDDYGNYSRECAIFVLNALAENMPENESLAEYFERKKES